MHYNEYTTLTYVDRIEFFLVLYIFLFCSLLHTWHYVVVSFDNTSITFFNSFNDFLSYQSFDFCRLTMERLSFCLFAKKMCHFQLFLLIIFITIIEIHPMNMVFMDCANVTLKKKKIFFDTKSHIYTQYTCIRDEYEELIYGKSIFIKGHSFDIIVAFFFLPLLYFLLAQYL